MCNCNKGHAKKPLKDLPSPDSLKASSFDSVTVTPAESTSSGLEWYWILLIVVGSILLVLLILYLGVKGFMWKLVKDGVADSDHDYSNDYLDRPISPVSDPNRNKEFTDT